MTPDIMQSPQMPERRLRSHSRASSVPKLPLLQQSDCAINATVRRDSVKTRNAQGARLKSPIKLTCGSPARRVPRNLSSPARRTSHGMTSIDLATDRGSPMKRNLGSPIRKASGKDSVTVLSTTRKSISERSQLHVAHGNTEHLNIVQCLQSASPLKMPAARGMKVSLVDEGLACRDVSNSSYAPERNHSPLKAAPCRNLRQAEHNLPLASIGHMQQDKDAEDELCMLKSPKVRRRLVKRVNGTYETDAGSESAQSIEAATKRTISSPVRSTRKSSLNDCAEEKDVDEIADSYTPIRLPKLHLSAYSPPSDELLESEEDHWTPSVPLSLAEKFSELILEPVNGPIIAIQPTHIFFGEDDNIVNEKTALKVTEIGKLKATADLKPVVFFDCKTTDEISLSEYLAILHELGAKTVDRWNWNPDTQRTPSRLTKVGITHVVFFQGTLRTLKKIKQARALGVDVACIGLSWIIQCQKSGRLSVGMSGHEIDIESEVENLSLVKHGSEDSRTSITTREERHCQASGEPRRVDDIVPIVPHEMDQMTQVLMPQSTAEGDSSSTSKLFQEDTSLKKAKVLTTFELQQLSLARRNSAKFRPPVSSPLSKKPWRA